MVTRSMFSCGSELGHSGWKPWISQKLWSTRVFNSCSVCVHTLANEVKSFIFFCFYQMQKHDFTLRSHHPRTQTTGTERNMFSSVSLWVFAVQAVLKGCFPLRNWHIIALIWSRADNNIQTALNWQRIFLLPAQLFGFNLLLHFFPVLIHASWVNWWL